MSILLKIEPYINWYAKIISLYFGSLQLVQLLQVLVLLLLQLISEMNEGAVVLNVPIQTFCDVLPLTRSFWLPPFTSPPMEQ